jgi:3-methylcrotonyl-CoA carboxylase beta subunit
MEQLETHVDASSPELRANRDRMQALVDELNQKLDAAGEGGGPKDVARHKEQGKVPPRERATALLDPDTARGRGLECSGCRCR